VSDNHFRQNKGQYGPIRFVNNLGWASHVSDPSGVPDTGPIVDPLLVDPVVGHLNRFPGMSARSSRCWLAGMIRSGWMFFPEGSSLSMASRICMDHCVKTAPWTWAPTSLASQRLKRCSATALKRPPA